MRTTISLRLAVVVALLCGAGAWHGAHPRGPRVSITYTRGSGEDGPNVKSVLLHPSGARAEIYDLGATVTRFTNADGRDLLWVSAQARLDGSKAIRGGIPLAFPQFGRPDDRMSQHGFARNAYWAAPEAVNEDGCSVTYRLAPEQATHEAFPYAYALEYRVEISAEALRTELRVLNGDDRPFSFQCLQHTYLSVGDIEQTRVIGFEGASFLDKVGERPDALLVDTREESDVAREVDRIYVAPAADPILVACAGGVIAVGKGAAKSAADGASAPPPPVDVVQWNPWVDKAARMSDFADDEYKAMICIEPGIVNAAQTLLPGEAITLSQSLSMAGEMSRMSLDPRGAGAAAHFLFIFLALGGEGGAAPAGFWQGNGQHVF